MDSRENVIEDKAANITVIQTELKKRRVDTLNGVVLEQLFVNWLGPRIHMQTSFASTGLHRPEHCHS